MRKIRGKKVSVQVRCRRACRGGGWYYGDPAAVPLSVWEAVCRLASGWTGYTHRWADCDQGLARYCMASVDTTRQQEEAAGAGWRTFRVRLPDEPVLQGEKVCPASKEGRRRKKCDGCLACNGAREGDTRDSIAIVFHGSSIARNYALRMFVQARTAVLAEERRRFALPQLN